MFNLEQSISDWREQLVTGGVTSIEVLDELESHLREDIARQTQSGIAVDAAFTAAVHEIGSAELLKTEFSKSGESLLERFLRSLSPDLQLAANMNTTAPNLESRLATYFKAATFALPAVFFWLLSAIFVLPKVNQMCQSAGSTAFHFDNAPFIFRSFSFIGQAMVYLTEHGILVCTTILVALALLEWRSKSWPRYRRATVGTGTFLLNTFVLVTITMMVVSAIVAANVLIPHAK